MGSILVLEYPDARAAGGIKTVTQTLEPTTSIVLINQKQHSVLNPVTSNYHSEATHFYLHLTFRLSQRLTKIMESAFQMNQFWEHAQHEAAFTGTELTLDDHLCSSFTVETKTWPNSALLSFVLLN